MILGPLTNLGSCVVCGDVWKSGNFEKIMVKTWNMIILFGLKSLGVLIGHLAVLLPVWDSESRNWNKTRRYNACNNGEHGSVDQRRPRFSGCEANRSVFNMICLTTRWKAAHKRHHPCMRLWKKKILFGIKCGSAQQCLKKFLQMNIWTSGRFHRPLVRLGHLWNFDMSWMRFISNIIKVRGLMGIRGRRWLRGRWSCGRRSWWFIIPSSGCKLCHPIGSASVRPISPKHPCPSAAYLCLSFVQSLWCRCFGEFTLVPNYKVVMP